MKKALIALLLVGAAQAAPYSWKGQLPAPLRAATDKNEGGVISGALLQGGLVDIRYGQVSIDLGGVSEVVDLGPISTLTLDGAPITPEELLKKVPQGLTATVRYDPASGVVGWLDAFSRGAEQARASSGRRPSNSPAYEAGDVVAVTLSEPEARRLGGAGKVKVSIPGVARDLPLVKATGGGWKATVRILPGWDLVKVPVFLSTPGKVYRAGTLDAWTTHPTIIGFGPHVASSSLEKIPGWVDLRSASRQIDPDSILLRASAGARIVDLQRRVDRTVFALQVDGPGEYWVVFSATDNLGRAVSQRWPVRVLPCSGKGRRTCRETN